ncbi:MAG TPA: hypothetical protein VGG07_14255 [Solirubrobacteraceae bacterium]
MNRHTLSAGREWCFRLQQLTAEQRALGNHARARELERLREATETEIRHELAQAGRAA